MWFFVCAVVWSRDLSGSLAVSRASVFGWFWSHDLSGLLYFLVRVNQAQSVVCNLWSVSGSRDRLACVVSGLLVCILYVCMR